jgi:hypothetical protein
MGIATKYVKDKGSCGTGGGGGGKPPDTELFMKVESDFYDKLSPRIFFSGAFDRLPEGLQAALETQLAGALLRQGDIAGHLHDAMACVFTNEAFISDKASFLYDIASSPSFKSLHVKVALRTCASATDAAFLVFHYTWEYLTADNLHMREDGECVQSWVRAGGDWQMLGEYMDGNHVEAVARVAG